MYLPTDSSTGTGQFEVLQRYLCGDTYKSNGTDINPLLILGHLLQPNPQNGPG